jgi:hypothetical protein
MLERASKHFAVDAELNSDGVSPDLDASSLPAHCSLPVGADSNLSHPVNDRTRGLCVGVRPMGVTHQSCQQEFLPPAQAAHRAAQAWSSDVDLFRQFTHFANLDAQVPDNALHLLEAGGLEFHAH